MKTEWYLYLRAPRAMKLTANRRVPEKHPLACIAVRALTPENGRQHLYIGISVWNPLDVFDRGKARAKALGRTHSENQRISTTVPEDVTYTEVNREVYRAVMDWPYLDSEGEHVIPFRVYDALKNAANDLERRLFPNQA